MKHLLSIFIFIFCSFVINAQSVKINQKVVVRPFFFKIEKMKVEGNETSIYFKVKQQNRFSYSISFEDCYVKIPSTGEVIKGQLKTWNDDRKNVRTTETVSDTDEEKFTLSFPTLNLVKEPVIELKIGNILDRNKTNIVVEEVKLKKK